MPILHVRALPQPARVDVSATLQALCRAVADAWGAAPSTVWATWETISPERYAEGGNPTPHGQPGGTHPPIVDLIAYRGRSPAEVERALVAVADVLVERLGMEPGNAFVSYRELGPGQVYTGGAVRR